MSKEEEVRVNGTILEESMRLLEATAPSTVQQELTFTASSEFNTKDFIKVSKRNSFLVCLSIIGCMIGAQTYSLPYATLKTGIWISLVINLYKCIIGILSCYLLIECQKMSKWNLPAKIGYY